MKPFKKEQVNNKLKPLGWEIPEGIPYKGMLENHAVKCVKCGWIQEKRLDNLIYRKEQCPACGNGVFDETILAEIQQLKDAFNKFKFEVLDALKLIREDKSTNTDDLKMLFKRYIAKKGLVMYGRRMTSDEWHVLSHELSEELMLSLAESEEQFKKWESFYIDLLSDHPLKQGQDILFAVIPQRLHGQLRDEISKRLVKL
mgnify:CR=1 FL=1